VIQARKSTSSTSELPGQDSFLDVVANIVGILIILVMVVGVRAAHSPRKPPDYDAAEEVQQDQLADERRAQSLLLDVRNLQQQSELMAQEALTNKMSRDQLQAMVATAEAELTNRRAQLDDQARRDFDIQASISASQAKLEQLTRQRLAIGSQAAETVEVVSLPTPLSKNVEGDEGHFQLRGGRITHVPLARLISRFKSAARQKAWKLQNQRVINDTVGPVDGFRLRYQLELLSVSVPSQLGSVQNGSLVRLVRWELLPDSSALGETIAQALSADSEFRRALKSMDPERVAITLWTYPDSFAEFRKLKHELYSLGYQTAGRPLPYGVRIGGSPGGTRSAAQ